jgi:hypothetical protein
MEPSDTDWLAALVRSAAGLVDVSIYIEGIDTVSLKGGYIALMLTSQPNGEPSQHRISSGIVHRLVVAGVRAEARAAIKSRSMWRSKKCWPDLSTCEWPTAVWRFRDAGKCRGCALPT